MKGIILAGGSGTRLSPATNVVSKQLLPVYDKPMIYYPLSTLMLAGITEILIISTPSDTPRFKELLGDGSSFGINLQYEIQSKPDGLAQAFIIGEEFIGSDKVCLILGDNIFFRGALSNTLKKCAQLDNGAIVFGHLVHDPERYGVAEVENGKVLSIEEKPTHPKSNYAVTGLYFYDNDVINIAKNIKPSHRGELEITDINKAYLDKGDLKIEILGRGSAWFDTGTHESLLNASTFVHTIEKNQGMKIACLEEISYRMGYINKEQLIHAGNLLKKNDYGKYLLTIADE